MPSGLGANRFRAVVACSSVTVPRLPSMRAKRRCSLRTCPAIRSTSRAAPVASARQGVAGNTLAIRDVVLPELVTGRIDVDSLGVDNVFGWTELAEAG